MSEPLRAALNRRQFLGQSAQNAAGMAAGMVGLAIGTASASPNEQVRIAVIGVRNQGKSLAASFARFPDVRLTTLCDVDENLLPAAGRVVEEVQGRLPRFERDFRRVLDDASVDAVVIATPDHWHAYMTILACQAGKDVYVEQPVSHSFLEGERMIDAARHFRRVVQTGLQQRSGEHFQSAIEFVRSGRLGTVRLAKAWTTHRRKSIGRRKDSLPPAGVDYDLWLGPAPERPFNPNRFHYNWHWFWDYGAGELGNSGVHMLDVARWGLGVDLPNRVAATGGKFHFHDDQETPDTLFVQYTFEKAHGPPSMGLASPERSTLNPQLFPKTILWEHRLWSTHAPEGRSTAAAFYGERGTLVVDRGGWKVYDSPETLTAGSSELAERHHRDFVDCIKSRQQPVAGLEVGHASSSLCHLGNLAFRLGREVVFDPVRNEVPNDPSAAELLTRVYRERWSLPTV